MEKGDDVDLLVPKFRIGIGWSAVPGEQDSNIELDLAAFLMRTGSGYPPYSNIVFYNRRQMPDGSVVLLKDSEKGGRNSDNCESLLFDMEKMPDSVCEIYLSATIYDSVELQHDFRKISYAFIRIFDEETKEEIQRFEFSTDLTSETGVIIGCLVRCEDEGWKFIALGEAANYSLEYLMLMFH